MQGKAAASKIIKSGGNVVICSRDEEKLLRASGQLGGKVSVRVVDNTKEEDVKTLFASFPDKSFDTLIVTALGRAVHGRFLDLDVEKVKSLFDGKLWGPWYCAKYGARVLKDGGSIVFVSGILNRRPGMNCSPLGSANGAIEALTRSLALELGPRLRVNCLCPGFVDTERFDHMPAQKKQRMLEATADSLPLKKVGDPEEIGDALYFLAANKFTTGVVLDVGK